jgi:hypothetical protein
MRRPYWAPPTLLLDASVALAAAHQRSTLTLDGFASRAARLPHNCRWSGTQRAPVAVLDHYCALSSRWRIHRGRLRRARRRQLHVRRFSRIQRALCVTVLRSVNAAMAAPLPIRPTLLCWTPALRWPLAAARLPTTPYSTRCAPSGWAAAARRQGGDGGAAAHQPGAPCWTPSLRWPLAAARLPMTPYPAPCVPPDWAAAALCQGVCAAGAALEAGAPVLDAVNALAAGSCASAARSTPSAVLATWLGRCSAPSRRRWRWRCPSSGGHSRCWTL